MINNYNFIEMTNVILLRVIKLFHNIFIYMNIIINKYFCLKYSLEIFETYSSML